MSFEIPKGQWLRAHDSDADIIYLGVLTAGTANNMLPKMKVGFYKNDCTGLFRIRIHTSRNFNKIYATSEWIDIEDVPFKSFVGNIRFDFLNEVNFVKNKKYYFTIESQGYVRTQDTNEMTWLLDSPFPTNVSTGNWPTDFPIRMEYFIK